MDLKLRIKQTLQVPFTHCSQSNYNKNCRRGKYYFCADTLKYSTHVLHNAQQSYISGLSGFKSFSHLRRSCKTQIKYIFSWLNSYSEAVPFLHETDIKFRLVIAKPILNIMNCSSPEGSMTDWSKQRCHTCSANQWSSRDPCAQTAVNRFTTWRTHNDNLKDRYMQRSYFSLY